MNLGRSMKPVVLSVRPLSSPPTASQEPGDPAELHRKANRTSCPHAAQKSSIYRALFFFTGGLDRKLAQLESLFPHILVKDKEHMFAFGTKECMVSQAQMEHIVG